MALDLKQTVKLSQQLVMTPQLQQAIKLLQLSRLELINQVQQELQENPVLEESLDDDSGPVQEGAEPEVGESLVEAATEPVLAEAADVAVDSSQATADQMISDVEWENYIDSSPQTSLSRPDDDRPPIVANLTPPTSLADHLLWQLGFAAARPGSRSPTPPPLSRPPSARSPPTAT